MSETNVPTITLNNGTAIPQLGRDYYTIMGAGLVIAFGVILLTLPLLRRMTAPSSIRFE